MEQNPRSLRRLEARFWIASEQLTIRALESYMDVSAKPGSRGRP